MTLNEQAGANYDILRECITGPIVHRSALLDEDSQIRCKRKSRKRTSQVRKECESVSGISADASDLTDFIDYIATELFTSFPDELQRLSYATIKNDEALAAKYDVGDSAQILQHCVQAMPASIGDSLVAYHLISDAEEIPKFMAPIVEGYVESCTAAPPHHDPAKKATQCEVCDRDWVPLTYHHLIPRQVHAKVLKRGWHEEWQLNSVAWLCRACHSFVHRIASNEELAKEWWSMERILQREDVQSWAAWVGRVRWKSK